MQLVALVAAFFNQWNPGLVGSIGQGKLVIVPMSDKRVIAIPNGNYRLGAVYVPIKGLGSTESIGIAEQKRS